MLVRVQMFGQIKQSHRSGGIFMLNRTTVLEQVYALLVRFSEKIHVIQDMDFRITGDLGNPYKDSEWERFNRYFREGTYFHYRCQGFMEALLATRTYSHDSLNIWANQLVYPAANNFNMAMISYHNIEIHDNQKLSELDTLLKEFKAISEAILHYANAFNSIGPDVHLSVRR
jgi:hypothetical protein